MIWKPWTNRRIDVCSGTEGREGDWSGFVSSVCAWTFPVLLKGCHAPQSSLSLLYLKEQPPKKAFLRRSSIKIQQLSNQALLIAKSFCFWSTLSTLERRKFSSLSVHLPSGDDHRLNYFSTPVSTIDRAVAGNILWFVVVISTSLWLLKKSVEIFLWIFGLNRDSLHSTAEKSAY